MTTLTEVRPVTAETEADALRGGADIWLLPEESVPELAAALDAGAMLTPQERHRHDRLVRADSRRRFYGARLLSRHALSHYADVPPDAWQFGTGPYGRPEITGGNQLALDFNISHTDGLITCVVSRYRRVGVDVERWPARPEAVRLAARVLTVAEQRRLNTLDEPGRRRAFSGYWVLKEAYTKALGLGLQRRFDSFEVYDTPAGCPVLSDPTAGPLDGGWQLALIDVPPGHLLGVAVRRAADEPPVRLRIRDARRELAPPGQPVGACPPVRGTRLAGLSASALG